MKNTSQIALCAVLLVATVAANATWTVNPDVQVEPHHAVVFKFALKQSNLEYLDSLLWQIADVKSPFAGKYLSHEQIADISGLPEESLQELEKYVQSQSGKVCDVDTHRSLHRDYLYVSTCAGQAKLILPNLNLVVFERSTDGTQVIRNAITMDIAENLYLLGLPTNLHAHVEGIHDLTDLPIEHFRATPDPSLPWSEETQLLTIKDMINFFGVNYDGIKDETLAVDDGQVRQAVVELDNAAFSQSALAAYQKAYGLPINPIKKVIGTQTTVEESMEASLDVQTITGISAHIETWDFVFGDVASWIDVVESIMSTKGAPKVLSVSWVALINGFTQSQVDAVNAKYLKFGLAGFTWVEGSGDWGPTLISPGCTDYVTMFPSASPYVLSVGGTKLNKGSSEELSWMHSSGGFTPEIERPSYQDEKVSHYLSTAKLPPNPKGRYSTKGRAVPDIAAFGAFQPVYDGSEHTVVGGTSAATPQITAMLALVNVHRYQLGLGPLGVINKTLWESEGVLHDVTQGYNVAGGAFGQCPGTYLPGFEVTEGWDPVTGLGSPRYPELLKLLTQKSS